MSQGLSVEGIAVKRSQMQSLESVECGYKAQCIKALAGLANATLALDRRHLQINNNSERT